MYLFVFLLFCLYIYLYFQISYDKRKEKWNKFTIKHYLWTDRVHILEDRSLRLDDVSTVDEGEYSCEADNAVGSVSAVGTLIVYCAY